MDIKDKLNGIAGQAKQVVTDTAHKAGAKATEAIDKSGIDVGGLSDKAKAVAADAAEKLKQTGEKVVDKAQEKVAGYADKLKGSFDKK